MDNDQAISNKPAMILIGLTATVWVTISLLVVGMCRAARVADRHQPRTSFEAGA
jgi:hypothetical protein